MKIGMDFQTVKDISDVSKGEAFIDILSAHGFTTEKIALYEPIKNDFDPALFAEMWKGTGKEGRVQSSMVLFKGQGKFKFWGMVVWNKNLSPILPLMNVVSLDFTVPAKTDMTTFVKLGDDLFSWSRAEYGYIDKSPRESDSKERIILDGLQFLHWINYFGPAYLNEPEIHVPDNSISVHHGVRLALADHPNDDRLNDKEYLDSVKEKIGRKWFREYPLRFIPKIPAFDMSEIICKR